MALIKKQKNYYIRFQKYIQELWKINLILDVAIIESSRKLSFRLKIFQRYFVGKINSTNVVRSLVIIRTKTPIYGNRFPYL